MTLQAQNIELMRSNAVANMGVKSLHMNAPFSVWNPALVAAQVSLLGGLGVLNAYHDKLDLAEQYAQFKEAGGQEFAVALEVPTPLTTPEKENFEKLVACLEDVLIELELPTHVEAYWPAISFEAQFEQALALKPKALISLYGGFRETFAEQLKRQQVLNIAVATSLLEAKVLLSAEVDALILQGCESLLPMMRFERQDRLSMSVMTLLASVRQLTDLPLIAMGAVSLASQVKGLMAMGANAVMLEGALLQTKELGLDVEVLKCYQWLGLEQSSLLKIFHRQERRYLKTALVEALEPYERLSVFAGRPAGTLFAKVLDQAIKKQRPEYFVLPVDMMTQRTRYHTVCELWQALSL